MTDEEKKFLFDLFEKHELSLNTIMSMLGVAATHMAMFALDVGNENLEQAMADLDADCMNYLLEHTED